MAIAKFLTGPQPRTVLDAAPLPPDPRADRAGFLRLDLNEDLSGPLVRAPLPRQNDLAMYQTPHALQRDLAARLKLPQECIKVTAGADEAIYGLIRAYLDPGDRILLPRPTFVEFPTAAWSVGAVVEPAPYGPDLTFPLEAFTAALRQGPKMAVIVSPANPTGDMLPPERVLELADSAQGTLLLVDEAYAEYGGRSVLESGPPPANVAVIRTFSKAYGLAAARVGYLVAQPPVIEAVRKVLPAYSLAGPSLALAHANLCRQEDLARRVRQVQAGQRRIAAWGLRHGMHVHTTSTNFVLLRLADDASARTLTAELETRGILVSDRTAVLPGTVRATVGAPKHVTAFLRAMEQIIQ
ncbi:MAG: histidinol-phosphate aminotransferase [Chloroflexi bacterium]|nr:histidinol-phosphate aminotransferase [Chloroflexota bacterium]